MTKNRRRIAAALLAAVFCLSAFSACGPVRKAHSESAAAAEEGLGAGLTFVTGSRNNLYYLFGCVLAEIIDENSGITLDVQTSEGSRENVEALRDGRAQIGIVQSDVLTYAWEGTRIFGQKADNISVIAELYKEDLQIVTTNPGLKSVADLKGKSVSIGEAGSGVYFNAVDVLEAYGLTEKDISPAYQSFGDSMEALKSGRLDAAFVVSGIPTAPVSGLAATEDIYFISLDDEHIDRLVESSPHYCRDVISREIYNTAGDVTTVAVGAVLAAADDVPEEDVFRILSDIFENQEVITGKHAKGAELNLETAASVPMVPYHRGAAKFYSEKGISVKVKE